MGAFMPDYADTHLHHEQKEMFVQVEFISDMFYAPHF